MLNYYSSPLLFCSSKISSVLKITCSYSMLLSFSSSQLLNVESKSSSSCNHVHSLSYVFLFYSLYHVFSIVSPYCTCVLISPSTSFVYGPYCICCTCFTFFYSLNLLCMNYHKNVYALIYFFSSHTCGAFVFILSSCEFLICSMISPVYPPCFMCTFFI